MEVEAPWRLTYRDGSGNHYRFWKPAEGNAAHFEYTPVRPENSSSGVYSGGEPQDGMLDDAQIHALWESARRLEADPSVHAASRMMGSGAFSLRTAGGERNFIVKKGASLRQFNELLTPFR